MTERIDLMRIVTGTIRGLNAPIHVENNTRPRKAPSDPIAMITAAPPAYHVLILVNGCLPGSAPWVAVTHTQRFGFEPNGPMEEVYTYLTPPGTVDRDSVEAVAAWLTPALLTAIARELPLASAARAADAGVPGPVEARDAITRIG